jgi:hypothetical protein
VPVEEAETAPVTLVEGVATALMQVVVGAEPSSCAHRQCAEEAHSPRTPLGPELEEPVSVPAPYDACTPASAQRSVQGVPRPRVVRDGTLGLRVAREGTGAARGTTEGVRAARAAAEGAGAACGATEGIGYGGAPEKLTGKGKTERCGLTTGSGNRDASSGYGEAIEEVE